METEETEIEAKAKEIGDYLRNGGKAVVIQFDKDGTGSILFNCGEVEAIGAIAETFSVRKAMRVNRYRQRSEGNE
jgi:hypothetical protein